VIKKSVLHVKNLDRKHLVASTPLRIGKVILFLLATQLAASCSSHRPLMPTPDVYALGIKEPYPETLPSQLRTVDVNIMYLTDRLPELAEDGRLDYGMGRNHSVALGDAVVNIGGDLDWEALAADARTGVRSSAVNLSVKSVTEKVQGPLGTLISYQADGSLGGSAEAVSQAQALAESSKEILRERLKTAPRKEVLLFVHGVSTSFDEALFTTAELWHYLGREFLPIAYSWPAGHGGALRGYTYDRESSEFTVFHFKRLLAWLAGIPDLEGIHIVAHSRGTDVVATAIRELTIEARASGKLPQEQFKLRNVVMASPDISMDVLLQRTEREGTFWAAERWTTYTSERDKAISLSEWLFSEDRFGKAGSGGIDPLVKNLMTNRSHGDASGRDSVIEYNGRNVGATGHIFFRTNPAVSSDLVLTVRYGLAPGAENGRPLDPIEGYFWKIGDDYIKALAK
jgi:esterase/lipase superfamily enzyme